MDCVAGPVQALAISIGAVEGNFQLLDPLLAASKTENALHIGCYATSQTLSSYATE